MICKLTLYLDIKAPDIVYDKYFINLFQYMLHYLKYLRDWFDPYTWEDIPITRTAWALLRDSYHGNICLKYKPQHIAIALIYFSLICHGIEVPHQEHVDNQWWQVRVVLIINWPIHKIPFLVGKLLLATNFFQESTKIHILANC